MASFVRARSSQAEKPIPDLAGAVPGMDLFQIGDLDVGGSRVLVRCDFNVPLHEGVITDDFRIRAAAPTLRRLLSEGAQRRRVLPSRAAQGQSRRGVAPRSGRRTAGRDPRRWK